MKPAGMVNYLCPAILICCLFGCNSVEQIVFSPDMVTLNIISPSDTDTLHFPMDESEDIRFEVRGESSGILDQPIDGHIYLMVFPTRPDGGGWFIQQQPASIENDGDWLATVQFGADGVWKPQNGDEFKIAAFCTAYSETVETLPVRIEEFSELPDHQMSMFVEFLIVARDR